MATYTLVITGADGHQHKSLTDFRDDDDARTSTAGVLSEEHPAIAIARGSGDDVVFLGAWDWCGGDPKWTEEE